MARRKKSKSRKWIVTGLLTAALAGGGWFWLGDDAARQMRGMADKPANQAERPAVSKAKPAAPAKPAAKVQRAQLRKPVAPVSMPVDAPRKLIAPRPSRAVGN